MASERLTVCRALAHHFTPSPFTNKQLSGLPERTRCRSKAPSRKADGEILLCLQGLEGRLAHLALDRMSKLRENEARGAHTRPDSRFDCAALRHCLGAAEAPQRPVVALRNEPRQFGDILHYSCPCHLSVQHEGM